MNIIHSYVHHDGSIGILAKFHCDTDFAARTPEFKEFMNNVCMAMVNFQRNFDKNDDSFFDITSMEMIHENITLEEYEQQTSKNFKENISLISWRIMTNNSENIAGSLP